MMIITRPSKILSNKKLKKAFVARNHPNKSEKIPKINWIRRRESCCSFAVILAKITTIPLIIIPTPIKATKNLTKNSEKSGKIKSRSPKIAWDTAAKKSIPL